MYYDYYFKLLILQDTVESCYIWNHLEMKVIQLNRSSRSRKFQIINKVKIYWRMYQLTVYQTKYTLVRYFMETSL